MSRRRSQPFNLSLLDLLTSALGAVIFLFIITPKGGAPPSKTQQLGVFVDTVQHRVFGIIPDSLQVKQVGDTLLAVLVDYKKLPEAQPAPKMVFQQRPALTPDRAAEAKPSPDKPEKKDPDKKAEVSKPETEEPKAGQPDKTPTPPPVYRGDAPSVPCLVSFEVNWDNAEDNVDLFVCKDGSCVYGGRKRDRSIGQWDSGKSRNRLFGNDLRTNQEAVRQFDQIVPGEYLLYAHFKNSRRDREEVRISGLIYTKSPSGQERGGTFSKILTRTEDRVLIGKVVLREDGQFALLQQ
jgi:hypothetical protein